jgi:hypothetical protein
MRIFILAIGVMTIALMASCASCNPPENGNESRNANLSSNSNSNDNRGSLATATPPPELTPSSPLDPNFKECNPYYPLIPGSEAKYLIVYSNPLQANVTIVVNQSTEGGVPLFEQKTQIVDKSGGLFKKEFAVQKYACENGRIKIIAETRDNTVEGRQSLMEMHYIDPAYTMLEPAALKPGATWSYAFTQSFQGPNGNQPPGPSTQVACAVEGQEDVTVPAGKFKVIKVSKKINKADIVEYYARGVGLVKRVSGDGTTWELQSFSGLKPGN